MENRFLVGDPRPNIQRAFRLRRWKRQSLSCHWHGAHLPGYLFLSILHSKRHWGISGIKQCFSIRAPFSKTVSEMQCNNISQWRLLGAPFSLFFFFKKDSKIPLCNQSWPHPYIHLICFIQEWWREILKSTTMHWDGSQELWFVSCLRKCGLNKFRQITCVSVSEPPWRQQVGNSIQSTFTFGKPGWSGAQYMSVHVLECMCVCIWVGGDVLCGEFGVRVIPKPYVSRWWFIWSLLLLC